VKSRDNFLTKVKERLKDSSGSKCSNPGCRIITVGAGENDKILNIGVAAHICAAAPGGPRYDDEMSKEERGSFKNGIWLCQNCATEIDRDVEKYPVHLLNTWKENAGREAGLNVGKKALNAQDSVDMLAAALSGYPKKFIAKSIQNTHMATSQALEILDPRFEVRSRYNGINTVFSLNAKEQIKLNVSLKNAKKYRDDHFEFINKGEPLSLDVKDITVSGSNLIKEILNGQDGKVTLCVPTINAMLKISLIDPKNNLIENVDNIVGNISCGKKYLTFKGECYDNSLGFKMLFPKKGDGCKFSTHLKVSEWANLDVRELPYFSKVCSFYEKITSGWIIDFKVEIKGELVFSGEYCGGSYPEQVKNITTLMKYTQCAREIAKFLVKEIVFVPNITFTADEHRAMRRAAGLLLKNNEYDVSHLEGNTKFALIVCDENRLLLVKAKGITTHFSMEAQEGEKISIFGKAITLPKERHEMINVEMLTDKDVETVENGQEINIEIAPSDGFKYIEKYVH
jgi:hypothetical protein